MPITRESCKITVKKAIIPVLFILLIIGVAVGVHLHSKNKMRETKEKNDMALENFKKRSKDTELIAIIIGQSVTDAKNNNDPRYDFHFDKKSKKTERGEQVKKLTEVS